MHPAATSCCQDPASSSGERDTVHVRARVCRRPAPRKCAQDATPGGHHLKRTTP
jgi:hypothetical protein